MIDWLFTTALAALALAVIVAVFVWTFRPSPAVRHALWLIVVLKLISPTGLVVSVPLPVDRPAANEGRPAQAPPELNDVVVEEELFTVYVTPRAGQSAEEAAVQSVRTESAQNEIAPVPPESGRTLATAPAAESRPIDYRPYLLGLWALGAIAVGWWQLRGTLRFARFARRGVPASESLVAEVAVVANRLGVRVPEVRVLTGLTSPVIWCLWRPVLLWPAGLECRVKGEGRRAVLAHELAHLRRRDHWVRRLEMIAAILHWWNPLFWIARKKLRSDAELACDAWAAGHADRRAYAEALLEVCSLNPRRRPAPAVGVFGEGRRAMQERLTMIMRDSIPCRLAFGAKLIVTLMALAAIPAWTLGQGAPPAPPAPPAGPDPQVQAIEAQIKALSEKLAALKAAEAQKKTADKAKDAHTALAEKLREIHLRLGEEAKAEKPIGVKVITSGEGGYKVIGPDGKELKDIKIIVVDPKGTSPPMPTPPTPAKPPAVSWSTDGKKVTVQAEPHTALTYAVRGRSAEGQAVTLSRATYKLGKDQATALSTLLGGIKATVMETKVDGESITVTTTPEVQSTIGQIVRLIQGQTSGWSIQYRTPTEYRYATPAQVAPLPPSTPKPATPPAPPAIPKKPGEAAQGLEDVLKLHLDVLDQLHDLKDLHLELKIDPANFKDLDKLKELDKLKGLEKLKDIEKLKELEKTLKLRLRDATETPKPKPEDGKNPGGVV